MSTVIDKAAAHCAEKKYDEAWLLTDRLFPDMFTLARQIPSGAAISAATSRAVWPAASCRTSPATDDTTFAEVKARVRSRWSM